MKISRNISGFTLVELIIVCTILALMSVAIVSIYLQTSTFGLRLKTTRYLSESAREITEKIAEDVRTKGITGSVIMGYGPYFDSTDGYTASGKEIIALGDGTKQYLYGKKNTSLPYFQPCNDADKVNPKIHCGLYVVHLIGGNFPNNPDDYVNLVDSFVPDESKKRVKLEDMKFYLSGDGEHTEKKLTLVFTLALMNRGAGFLLSDTKLHIQTTISEQYYKQN